jgi:hypothetical protein
MANVVQVPNLADDNAYYVWAGHSGPQWGEQRSFADATLVRQAFPEGDWTKATEAAARQADEKGVPTVYVVRNA